MSDEEYVRALAYLLSMNGMPAGSRAAGRRLRRVAPYPSRLRSRRSHHPESTPMKHASSRRRCCRSLLGAARTRAEPHLTRTRSMRPGDGPAPRDRAQCTRRHARRSMSRPGARQRARRMALLGRRRVEHALLAARPDQRRELRLAAGGVAVERRHVRPGRVLSHHAAVRERPAVHRGDHAARRRWRSIRRPARRCGCTGSTKASAGRRRRGSSPAAARRTGPTARIERVIVVTPGYHLVSLDAKTGMSGSAVRQERRRRPAWMARLSAGAAGGRRLRLADHLRCRAGAKREAGRDVGSR